MTAQGVIAYIEAENIAIIQSGCFINTSSFKGVDAYDEHVHIVETMNN